MRDAVNITIRITGLKKNLGCGVVTKLPGKYNRHNVGGKSNSYGFLLVLFIFYFLLKVAGDHVHVVAGGNPRPPPLNDSPGVGMMGLGNPQME